MSISGIQGSTFNPYQFASSSPLQQQLQQLGQALQSGNLSAAQSDFASLQQAFSQPAATNAPATSPLGQAFNQLASDLQSGNLSAAQKDFSPLQQDVQSLNGSSSRYGHHHHHSGGGPGSQKSIFPDPNQPIPSSSSSATPGAPPAYGGWQQQLAQYALGGAASGSESPVSFEA
jgi:hypothetical protein